MLSQKKTNEEWNLFHADKNEAKYGHRFVTYDDVAREDWVWDKQGDGSELVDVCLTKWKKGWDFDIDEEKAGDNDGSDAVDAGAKQEEKEVKE